MNVDEKYEQWKAITESDFVTLFIKTWFTYIAVLRKLNPDVKVFTEDGLPRGDKPFLNAFKEGIMPIVQKCLPIDTIENEFFNMYPIGMKKVIDVFPQYFFQTFYRINEDFHFEDIDKHENESGTVKTFYRADVRIVERFCLKVYLEISGKYKWKIFQQCLLQ